MKAGLSQQMVSYVERGLRTPSLDTLVRMADAVGCDLPNILTQARSDIANRARGLGSCGTAKKGEGRV